MPQAYPRVRDELIANLEQWMRTGSVPDDVELAKSHVDVLTGSTTVAVTVLARR